MLFLFFLVNIVEAYASPVRYAKFESIRHFIDIDILQNCLIDIDIDIFQICRYIDYRYKYSIFHPQIRAKNTKIG